MGLPSLGETPKNPEGHHIPTSASGNLITHKFTVVAHKSKHDHSHSPSVDGYLTGKCIFIVDTRQSRCTAQCIISLPLPIEIYPNNVEIRVHSYTSGSAPSPVSDDGRVLRDDIHLGLAPASFVQMEGYYKTPITIGEGTHAKTFTMQFDTGSPDLWVFSTLLLKDQRGHHVLYDPIESNSSIPMPRKTWNITYIDGSGASGVVFSDTLNIGGIIVKKTSRGNGDLR